MSPEVSEQEVVDLARLMTLKFGFANIYYGGAKAGIHTKEDLSEHERTTVLKAFGRKFRRLLQAEIYRPGEDIGTCSHDVITILEAARHNKSKSAPASSGLYTAMSIVTTVEALCRHHGVALNGASLILEGFGKVGSRVAHQLCEKGIKLLAVSTKAGAIYHPQGLNLPHLIRLRDRYGDAFVLHYPEGELITLEQMVTLKMDILILAGKAEAIHTGNCDAVKARIVVPGGNLSMTREAEMRLVQRGYFIFPDFVVNCGGVVGLNYGAGLSDDNIQRLIAEELGKKLGHLLHFSRKYSVRLREISEFIALRNISRMQEMVSLSETGRMLRFFEKLRSGSLPWIRTQILRLLANQCQGSNATLYAYKRARFWADRNLYHRLMRRYENTSTIAKP